MEWYYSDNGAQSGPVGDEEIQQLARSGKITPDTLVWHAGLSEWQPYSKAVPSTPPALATAALPGTFEYAGFWIRFLAKLIDGLIVTLVLGIPFGIFIFIMVFKARSSDEIGSEMAQMGIQLLVQMFYICFLAVYETFFIGKFGATPGKMAVKIKVVLEDGDKVSYARALGRYFAGILSGLFTCNIGYIMAAFDEEKRALHDRICSTRVIKKQ